MKQCPKCGYKQDSGNVDCPSCGIVFSKYVPRAGSNRQSISKPTSSESSGLFRLIRSILFYVNPSVNPLFFGGRFFVLLVLAVWGVLLMDSPIQDGGESILHYVSLPFHEAGHIIFSPFGRFFTSFGGTLGQLLMPVICLFVLLIQTRDTFGSAVCLWWLGQNFIDIAPYIDDARSLKLMLLGGVTGGDAAYGYHDWEFMLKELGISSYDHFLAKLSCAFGIFLILLSLIWGGFILFKQYRNLA